MRERIYVGDIRHRRLYVARASARHRERSVYILAGVRRRVDDRYDGVFYGNAFRKRGQAQADPRRKSEKDRGGVHRRDRLLCPLLY